MSKFKLVEIFCFREPQTNVCERAMALYANPLIDERERQLMN